MADKSDSGHVIVPVAHPSGEVHDIAVPASLPLSDLHEALSSYYKGSQPTVEGSVEHSDAFRNAGYEAQGAQLGSKTKEAGFTVGRDGSMGKTTTHDAGASETIANMDQTVDSSMLGAAHTHPSQAFQTGQPSPRDIKAAKTSRKTIWTSGYDGLWSVDPQGAVLKIYDGTKWQQKSKKK